MHEEVIRTTLLEAQELYDDDKRQPRGEYVIIVEGAKEPDEPVTEETALEQVKALVGKGMRAADACREIAKATGLSKSELYSMLLSEKE